MERITNDIFDKRYDFLTMDDITEKHVGNLFRIPKSSELSFTFTGKPYDDCPTNISSFDKPIMMSVFLNRAKYPEQHKISRYSKSILNPEKYGEDF